MMKKCNQRCSNRSCRDLILVLLSVCAILMSGILFPVREMRVQAKEKPYLSEEYLSLGIGEKYQITVSLLPKKAKVFFTSNKKSVVVVKKKTGVVKGVKPGNCKIKASYKYHGKKKKLGAVRITVQKAQVLTVDSALYNLESRAVNHPCVNVNSDHSAVQIVAADDYWEKTPGCIWGDDSGSAPDAAVRYRNYKATYWYKSSNPEVLSVEPDGTITKTVTGGAATVSGVAAELILMETYKGTDREMCAIPVQFVMSKINLACYVPKEKTSYRDVEFMDASEWDSITDDDYDIGDKFTFYIYHTPGSHAGPYNITSSKKSIAVSEFEPASEPVTVDGYVGKFTVTLNGYAKTTITVESEGAKYEFKIDYHQYGTYEDDL